MVKIIISLILYGYMFGLANNIDLPVKPWPPPEPIIIILPAHTQFEGDCWSSSEDWCWYDPFNT